MNSLSTGQNPNENYKNFCGQAINFLTQKSSVRHMYTCIHTGVWISSACVENENEKLQ